MTESMHQSVASPVNIRILHRVAGVRDRHAILHAGVVTTLERLATAVEKSPAPVL